MNTPAPTPADLLHAGALLANVAFNWAQQIGHVLTPDDAAMLDKLRREWDDAKAALSFPAPAKAAPSAQQIVAWHVHFPGCDGTADWVELGSEAPDVSGWAGAVVLPLAHAQSPQATPLLQDADRALSKALAATPEAYRRPKAALSAVPEGYALVPVEPTPLMMSALQAQTIAPAAPGREVWAAMLAAAPSTPVPAAPVVAAPVERQPLTTAQLDEGAPASLSATHWFVMGARFAERAHGITGGADKGGAA